MDYEETLMAEKVTAMNFAECRLKGGYEIINFDGENEFVPMQDEIL